MKKIFVIMILVLTLSQVFAQIQWSEKVTIRQGVNIEWSRAAAPMEDGSVIYVWSDTRFGDRDLWAQKVDAAGNMVWGDEAVLVNGMINRQEDPVVINVGDGGVVIAWVDFRNEDAGDIYAQKLDSSGNILWDASGVPLCLAEEIQISLNIVSDEAGGAFVIWQDERNPGGSDIYGTHIETNGSISTGWATNGNAIAAEGGHQNQHTFWEDGTGGAIIAWHDTRDDEDENIYMQRIAPDGSLLWDAGGSMLAGSVETQDRPKITPDGTGNFIFAWRDKRNDSTGDIYAQRVDLNGDLLWSNDVVVYGGEFNQRNPRIKKASDNGVIITWEDGRNEFAAEFKDIYAQKLDLDGNLLWDANGVQVVSAEYDQINPRLNSDNNGGCWITWEDGRIENHPDGDIYVQHINSNGVPTLSANGNVICDQPGFQFSPLVKLSGGDVFLVWGDLRTGSTGMYVQVLNSAGVTQLAQDGELIYYGLDGDALNHKLLPYGDKQVILWEDTRNASIAIQLYMQVLNTDGSLDLTEDGEPITLMTGYDQQNMDAYLEPGSDMVTAIWEENKADKKKVYAQAVDLSANSLWNDDGLELSSEDLEQYNGQISYDNGSYYTGWSDYNGNFMDPIIKITGQKIDASGNLQWGDEGILISERDGDDILTDVVGRYYIWQNESWPVYEIYAKLVNEDGSTADGWDDNGTLICGAEGTQSNAKGIITPNGLLIVWKDERNVAVNSLDIYGQLISEDGVTQWADDGIPLVSLEGDQSLSNFLYNDGLVTVWEDFRSGSVYDIYMQKYNDDGIQLWADNGQEVVVKPTNQQVPFITTNNSEYMVFWEDKQSASNTDLYAKMFNADGSTYDNWPAGGKVISNAIKNQLQPLAVTYNDNAYVIWSDTRSSGKTDIYNIYAQKVGYLTNSIDDEEIPDQFNYLRQNFPNPFKTNTSISFNIDVDQYEDAKVKIFNVKGQQIRSIDVEENQIIWNGRNTSGKIVSAGIYFYKLEAKGLKTKPRKMLLLK